MRSLVRTLLYLTLLSAFGSPASDIHVSAARWEGYSEPSGNGKYLDLIRAIYPEHRLQFDISTYARAKRLFNQGKSDILVGIYQEDASHLSNALLPRYNIDVDSPLIVIFDPNRNSLSGPEDLQHKIVGWYDEYHFERYLEVEVVVYPFREMDNALVLLRQGRIDAIVDYAYNLGQDELELFKTMEITKGQKIFLAFKDTAEGHALREQFDEAMPKLLASGYLKQLYQADFDQAKFAF